MILSKKITTLILASMLCTSSFTTCQMNTTHKKYLTISGYSILGAYCAKRTLESIGAAMKLIMAQIIMPNRPSRRRKLSTGAAFLAAHLINTIDFCISGFLTYFSIKKVIQHIEDDEKAKKSEPEKKNMSVTKKET